MRFFHQSAISFIIASDACTFSSARAREHNGKTWHCVGHMQTSLIYYQQHAKGMNEDKAEQAPHHLEMHTGEEEQARQEEMHNHMPRI
jgi:hypothetical protein